MKRLTTSLVLVAAALALPGRPCAAQSSESYFNEAQAKHREGNLSEAVRLYSKAIENDKRDVMAYQMRGAAWQKMRQFQYAIYDYSMVIQLGEPLFRAAGYFNRGVVKNMRGQYAEAIPDFTEAIGIDRKMAAAFFHRAIARLKTGDSTGTLQDFIRAARLGDPDAARWLDATTPNWKELK
ncbi:tetratricopeptide repeat protein [Chlorobaculum sp. 24CR]|uniref:tetratricopeptide repeat protein n=1 Tax=Chlorobaculum sp. 24CR TaxID=2508878 RepID=UPI00100B974D|nr:tetratricopeptide repeat protein [Chlorobaculum sp. 24CR]RXK88415.1 tetratricopeptide repeat protein [Chlorobaculum sp. 24CR]